MTDMTPIREAIYRRQPEVARTLIQQGATPDFYDACGLGDREMMESFLARDPALASSFSEDGFSPLGLAVFFGHRDLAIHLLARGAAADVASRNALRVTPLHSAASTGDLLMSAVLLSHGADPNARDGSGGTPLHTAAGVGHAELVKLLVRHGANGELRNDGGETPLDTASRYKQEEIAAWLAGLSERKL